MEKAILDFNMQFDFKPEIKNVSAFRPAQSFIIAGMGGSHLAADLLSAYDPSLDVYVHRDYGLPALNRARLEKSLLIACSYSGNTEETLDFAAKAIQAKLNLAVVAVGGKLMELAKKNNLPYIALPDTGIQPRAALGFSISALAKFLGDQKMITELAELSKKLSPEKIKDAGEKLAKTLKNHVPIIYSSNRNFPVAYNWKIKLNETGKIPAFCNVLPELNHNEMTGFDVIPKTKQLSEKFHFLFLSDENDHPSVKMRMLVCKKLYEKRGLPVTILTLSGSSVFEKIFNSLLLADWTALHTANFYGAESEQVPMVEEFKKLIV
jgi:glucose/mannose-6-phosphate isomerase